MFRKAASALEASQSIALVTVIATIGSSPGKVGYKMLVTASSRETAGTIGGGLIEAKMIEEAKNMLTEPSTRVFGFNLGGTPEDEKGICGGSVQLLIETFDRGSLGLFKRLSEAIGNNEAGVLVSIICPGKPPQKVFLADAGQIDAAMHTQFPSEIAAAIRDITAEAQGARRVSTGGMDVFMESVTVSPTVVLFGAGHLSSYVCKYAKSVHFRVVVCDDRYEYANRQRFPDADDIIVEDLGRIFQKIHIDGNSYVVIVTRGHKYDEIALAKAVETNARYIGMIGSKRKTLAILTRLRQKGVSAERLNRVYSPIGVSIGALTPAEIALSIVCELVKIRRLGPGAKVGHMKECFSRGSLGGII